MPLPRPLALGLAIALVSVAAAAPTALATSTYPDLRMAPLRDFRIETTPDGRKLLRFTTVIVNVGDGPFEVRGSRSSSSDPMTGYQCVYDGTTCTMQSTAVAMQWSGDGHIHWHVVGLEEYELDRLDNGVLVGTGAKTGFCFFDNARHDLSLPGAPASVVYTNCGTSSSDASVTMGLSVGWGDTYIWNLAYQWVDITGLVAGSYRLWATADPQNWFVETDQTNNFTWVDLQIRGKQKSVRVMGYGPSA